MATPQFLGTPAELLRVCIVLNVKFLALYSWHCIFEWIYYFTNMGLTKTRS